MLSTEISCETKQKREIIRKYGTSWLSRYGMAFGSVLAHTLLSMSKQCNQEGLCKKNRGHDNHSLLLPWKLDWHNLIMLGSKGSGGSKG